jgi:hypothetical protein
MLALRFFRNGQGYQTQLLEPVERLSDIAGDGSVA